MSEQETKCCKGCNTTKSVKEFYKNKARSDGLQSYCKPCMKNQNVDNYKKHKDSWDKRTKDYGKSEENKKYRREWAKNKYSNNEEHRKNIIKKSVEYERKRLEYDNDFKLIKILRSRMRSAISAVKKNDVSKEKSTMELTGCTVDELKKHIEKQFKPGMNWSNHSVKGFHIDHIIPCASFDLTKEEEQKKCFHYTNLQPLWAEENLSKGAKV